MNATMTQHAIEIREDHSVRWNSHVDGIARCACGFVYGARELMTQAAWSRAWKEHHDAVIAGALGVNRVHVCHDLAVATKRAVKLHDLPVEGRAGGWIYSKVSGRPVCQGWASYGQRIIRSQQLVRRVFFHGQQQGSWVVKADLDRALEAAGTTRLPLEGVDRCACGSKYWEGSTCHSCGETFTGTSAS